MSYQTFILQSHDHKESIFIVWTILYSKIYVIDQAMCQMSYRTDIYRHVLPYFYV